MRSSLLTLLAVVVVGTLVILLTGSQQSDRTAQTLGVAPFRPISLLNGKGRLCQRPIALASDLDAVQFTVGTSAKPPPPVMVTLRSLSDGRILGSGRLGGEYNVGRRQTVRVGHVAAGPDVELCFQNEGPGRLALYGDVLNAPSCTPTGGRIAKPICVPGAVRPTLTTSAPFVNGKPLQSDVSADFLRDQKRSLLAQVPAMTRRASLFRPGFVSPALWWLLLAGWLVAAPAGLGYALRRSLHA